MLPPAGLSWCKLRLVTRAGSSLSQLGEGKGREGTNDVKKSHPGQMHSTRDVTPLVPVGISQREILLALLSRGYSTSFINTYFVFFQSFSLSSSIPFPPFLVATLKSPVFQYEAIITIVMVVVVVVVERSVRNPCCLKDRWSISWIDFTVDQDKYVVSLMPFALSLVREDPPNPGRGKHAISKRCVRLDAGWISSVGKENGKSDSTTYILTELRMACCSWGSIPTFCFFFLFLFYLCLSKWRSISSPGEHLYLHPPTEMKRAWSCCSILPFRLIFLSGSGSLFRF